MCSSDLLLRYRLPRLQGMGESLSRQGGGGQPFQEGMELAGERGETLYEIDRNNPVRFSHENASVQRAYDDFFDKPLSHRAHELLHTDQTKWSLR